MGPPHPGASLGSAIHGSDERAQAILGLLAPDPQGTTSSGGVEVVASIGGKPADRRRQTQQRTVRIAGNNHSPSSA